jgi:hypothetical protein
MTAATTKPTAPTTTAEPSSTTTSATASSTTTAGPGWWREITTEDPLRVWVIGDSLAGPLGNALVDLAAQRWLVVIVDGEGGTGLAREDIFDWPGRAAQRLPEVGPEAVVCLIGANDGQALRVLGSWLQFGTPEWDTEYSARVGAFMDLLAGASRRLYWVEIPIMAGAEHDGRVRRLNALHRAQAAAREQVVYVEAYALFQDEDGGFARELPDEQGHPVTVRQPDGVHFTGAGADRLAGQVLSVVAGDWLLAAWAGD